MSPVVIKLLPFLAWRSRVTKDSLHADAIAGLTGALVVLPQGVAYATLAGLPPQFGLYCAIVPVIVAALWGSSWHQISGPTNALSLVVFAAVAPLAVPLSDGYVSLVLTLTVMVGLFQFAAGLARMGTLVNFISHTVIVGFTAGAGLLIIAAQLRTFFGVRAESHTAFFQNLFAFGTNLPTADPWITITGVVTLIAALIAKQKLPRVPFMVVAMVAGSLFAWALSLAGIGNIPTVGRLPSGLPQLSAPSLNPDDWRKLAPAALALTVLGLTEAVSIARAIAVKTGQRIDGNQEFIGQGLSNIAGAFTSAYPSSGSFNRTGVNFESGARTPLSAVFSALSLVVVLFAIGPLTAYLPLSVMAALLFIVAWGLLDFKEMRRIARTNRGDFGVLAVTFLSTLAIQLEFAVFVGVLASLLVYLNRTTRPRLIRLAPATDTPDRRFVPLSGSALPCPQIDVLRLDGSLYFGAVEHVHDELEAARRTRPDARHVLFVFSGVNFIDVAGCEFLSHAARILRDGKATLYLCNLKPAVQSALVRGGFLSEIGENRVYATKTDAIRAIYSRLDAATCAGCRVRIFSECQTNLPDGSLRKDPMSKTAA